jgi:hypothetical protein
MTGEEFKLGVTPTGSPAGFHRFVAASDVLNENDIISIIRNVPLVPLTMNETMQTGGVPG